MYKAFHDKALPRQLILTRRRGRSSAETRQRTAYHWPGTRSGPDTGDREIGQIHKQKKKKIRLRLKC